jgi:hypothetical protein
MNNVLGLSAGGLLPVAVRIGNQQSQSGVTIAVELPARATISSCRLK